MATLQELEDDLISDITVDKIFRTDEEIVWPLEESGDFYWQTIKMEFRGFVVGKGDENPDEPEFLVTYHVSPVGTGYFRYPTGVLDPPSVEDEKSQNVLQPAFEYSYLHDRAAHRIVLICNAIDADRDSAWDQVLKAFSSDVRASIGTVMGGFSVPSALAGFSATPRALMDFFLSKLGSILTDDPEVIGERTVVDLEKVWRRRPSQTNWTALKITRHPRRPSNDPWYLTLWRIELDAGPFPATGADVPPPADGSGSGVRPLDNRPAGIRTAEPSRELGMNLDQPITPLYAGIQTSRDNRFAAVLRVLQGENAGDVSKDYGLTPSELERGRDLMLKSGIASFEGFLRTAILGELHALREEIDRLKKSKK